jgi:hypothetical protein
MPRDRKIAVFYQKKCYFFSAEIFSKFLVNKALDPDWIRIGIQHKMLDPDPDEMNADPQRWILLIYILCPYYHFFFIKSQNKNENLYPTG